MEPTQSASNAPNLQTTTSTLNKAIDEQESQMQKLLDQNQEQMEQIQQQQKSAQITGLGISLDIKA